MFPTSKSKKKKKKVEIVFTLTKKLSSFPQKGFRCRVNVLINFDKFGSFDEWIADLLCFFMV
jgi:hypothetical protein